jgi:DeoR family transcriptional regulator, aga operon transcriptional repressor
MLNVSPQERLRLIMDRLHAGSVSVQKLARETGVSEITVRRDLASLERKGKLLRVYGGAVPKERVAYEFSFKEKESLNREQKESIGRAAAGLVGPGVALFLDTGTTSLAAARAMRAVKPRVIITVNLCIASEYVGQRETRVLVPGGEVSALSPDIYGDWTLETLSNVTVDVAFLGCDAVDLSDGFYSADTRSAAVCRLMLTQSRCAYLLADHSKFGRRSMCRIASLNKLKGVITDAELPKETRKAIQRLGLELIMETGRP